MGNGVRERVGAWLEGGVGWLPGFVLGGIDVRWIGEGVRYYLGLGLI